MAGSWLGRWSAEFGILLEFKGPSASMCWLCPLLIQLGTLSEQPPISLTCRWERCQGGGGAPRHPVSGMSAAAPFCPQLLCGQRVTCCSNSAFSSAATALAVIFQLVLSCHTHANGCATRKPLPGLTLPKEAFLATVKTWLFSWVVAFLLPWIRFLPRSW